MRSHNLYSAAKNLPVPQDDGACDHLRGMLLPSLSLPSTTGGDVDLSGNQAHWTIVYCYPRTGRPEQEPVGEVDAWNAIPGARGCTPQSCAYRDLHAEISRSSAVLYGLSTQDTAYQAEAVDRLHLPFPLLSDASLTFAKALRLPTFTFAGSTLIKRLTLMVRAGRIEEVFYPVFPSDADARRVLAWLTSQGGGCADARG